MKSVSIICLNWNTKELTKQCLEGWGKQARTAVDEKEIKEAQIIVVDNGSTDGSVAMLRELTKQLGQPKAGVKMVLMENKDNVGYAKGNNQGIVAAEGDYILLVNSDTLPKPGALTTLVRFLDSNSSVAIVGPRLVYPDERGIQRNAGAFPTLEVVFTMLFLEHWGGNDKVRKSPKTIERVDWLVGACFMARREVFKKVGGLDETIFMYFEEVDWFYRTAKLGHQTWFTPEAEVVHYERASSKTGKKQPIILICQGLLHFYRKHMPVWQYWLVWLMVKKKALLAYGVGMIKGSDYLKETYQSILLENRP